MELSTRDRAALARTIAGEIDPRSSPYGRESTRTEIANILESINTRSALSGKSFEKTVKEKRQYSTWNTKANRATANAQLSKHAPAINAAIDDYFTGVLQPTHKGITHYFNPSLVKPGWAKSMQPLATIGPHAFYADPKMLGTVAPQPPQETMVAGLPNMPRPRPQEVPAVFAASAPAASPNAVAAAPQPAGPQMQAGTAIDAMLGGQLASNVPGAGFTPKGRPSPVTFASAPVASAARMSSAYGPRTHPVTGQVGKMHTGIDLAHQTPGMAAEFHGTPALAVNAGTVTKAAVVGGYGNQVTVDFGNGFSARYGHLDTMDVKEGDVVQAGQQIGTVGNTGRSTAAHLHLEVVHNATGKFLDPAPFMSKIGQPVQPEEMKPMGPTLAPGDIAAHQAAAAKYGVTQPAVGAAAARSMPPAQSPAQVATQNRNAALAAAQPVAPTATAQQVAMAGAPRVTAPSPNRHVSMTSSPMVDALDKMQIAAATARGAPVSSQPRAPGSALTAPSMPVSAAGLAPGTRPISGKSSPAVAALDKTAIASAIARGAPTMMSTAPVNRPSINTPVGVPGPGRSPTSMAAPAPTSPAAAARAAAGLQGATVTPAAGRSAASLHNPTANPQGRPSAAAMHNPAANPAGRASAVPGIPQGRPAVTPSVASLHNPAANPVGRASAVPGIPQGRPSAASMHNPAANPVGRASAVPAIPQGRPAAPAPVAARAAAPAPALSSLMSYASTAPRASTPTVDPAKTAPAPAKATGAPMDIAAAAGKKPGLNVNVRGALTGIALGSMIGGPVGAAVGGLIGSQTKKSAPATEKKTIAERVAGALGGSGLGGMGNRMGASYGSGPTTSGRTTGMNIGVGNRTGSGSGGTNSIGGIGRPDPTW